NRKPYEDSRNLLAEDQRQDWWRRYGAASGKEYSGLPAALTRRELTDVTAQPLLNYLIALSFARGRVDFQAEVNLNVIYEDLLEAVYERAYAGHVHRAIRGMEFKQFTLVLEEIGVAAWHGDGRTTTLGEIEQHCVRSGLSGLLDIFQEGAKAGITRLL